MRNLQYSLVILALASLTSACSSTITDNIFDFSSVDLKKNPDLTGSDLSGIDLTLGPDLTAPKNEVIVKDNTFDPLVLEITMGTTVKWTWATSDHTVHSGSLSRDPPGAIVQPDGEFCSGLPFGIPPSKTSCNGTLLLFKNKDYSFTHTFNDAGMFKYHCAKHASLALIPADNAEGKIIVK